MRRRLRQWGEDHLRAAVGSLGRLARTRGATAMTVLVIGISVALPAGFMLLLHNMERLTGDWGGTPRISLFLYADVTVEDARQLSAELIDAPTVVAVDVVSPDEALEEFRAMSDMRDALALLESNPLPALLVVTPAPALEADGLRVLTDELESRAEVDQARLDLQWVQRLDAIMDLVRRGVWLIAVLLAVSVLLVVGNTVRLAIENRREEIVITKLIGATDAFIRRPFLYEGVWYGLLGGALAALFLESGRMALSAPARRLAELYQTGPLLEGAGLAGAGSVVLVGVGLGLAGSWLAVARHLAAIEPR